MKPTRYLLTGIITGFLGILSGLTPALGVSPPYSAPVIREVEFTVKNGQIEVTLNGLFHAGTKTAIASCEPFLKNMEFNSRKVTVVRKPRRVDDEDSRGRMNMAEAAKILLPIFLTGPHGVECVFTLRDEEPSSKTASQRTSAPRRVHVVTDDLLGVKEAMIADVVPRDGSTATCSEGDEKIGSDGLPVDPAATVVVGDIVYANVTSSFSTVSRWYRKDGLYASDFDLVAVQPGGERKKLTVDIDDFSQDKMPLTIGVVIDASGSMRDTLFGSDSRYSHNVTKRSLAESAATRIVSNALRAGMKFIPPKDPGDILEKGTYIPLSNAFVMNFNEDFILNGEENPGVNAGHFTKDENQLSSWITGKGSGGSVVLRGGTRLLDAVYRSVYEINQVAARESCKSDPRVIEMRSEMEKKRVTEKRASYTYQENSNLKHFTEEVLTVKRRRVLFVISDGRENGSELKLDRVVEYLLKSGVVLYAISYDKDAVEVSTSVLPELAKATGGRALVVNLVHSANSIENDVNEFTSTVIADLVHQYELTFKETLDTCSKLEMHAYDTSRLGETWRALEKEFKRLTCQIEPSSSQSPNSISNPNGVTIPGLPPERAVCVPDSHAFLVPWDRYYADHFRDDDIPEVQVTHRTHIGSCSPAEIRALTDRNETNVRQPSRPKGK